MFSIRDTQLPKNKLLTSANVVNRIGCALISMTCICELKMLRILKISKTGVQKAF